MKCCPSETCCFKGKTPAKLDKCVALMDVLPEDQCAFYKENPEDVRGIEDVYKAFLEVESTKYQQRIRRKFNKKTVETMQEYDDYMQKLRAIILRNARII